MNGQKLLESAKKNKRAFLMLKELAIRIQDFELASELRTIEKDLFPDSEEIKQAKELNTLFRMVELKTDNETCWLINQVMKAYTEMGGEFSIKDASKILSRKAEIFE